MFKPTQKFRLIINNVSIYSTTKQIVSGIGDFVKVNEAARLALASLENMREDSAVVGLTGDWNNYQVQIDML